MNITNEDLETNKRSTEYDGMFFSLLEKVNKGLKEEEKAIFNTKEKTLYINGKIKANDLNFICLCDSYKFYLQKSLF